MNSADVFVIFGITGDLAKVMTFHSLYRLAARQLLTSPIIGVAADPWTPQDLRDHARAAIEGPGVAGGGEKIDEEVFERLLGRMSYFEAKRADTPGPQTVTADVDFSAQRGGGATPYEVLLNAALNGDSTRFTRQDGVEEEWRILQPLLDSPPPVHTYAKGSMGPDAADQLVAAVGGWHKPWGAA